MKRLLFCLIIACLWGNIAISATTIPHIMAYDLRVAQSGNDYTFTFFANTQPISGKLLFHTISGESLGEYTIPQPLQSGDNTITIPASALPSLGAYNYLLQAIHSLVLSMRERFALALMQQLTIIQNQTTSAISTLPTERE